MLWLSQHRESVGGNLLATNVTCMHWTAAGESAGADTVYGWICSRHRGHDCGHIRHELEVNIGGECHRLLGYHRSHCTRVLLDLHSALQIHLQAANPVNKHRRVSFEVSCAHCTGCSNPQLIVCFIAGLAQAGCVVVHVLWHCLYMIGCSFRQYFVSFHGVRSA